jgi:DNA-binding transcriptional LysR family regulator
VGAFKYPTRSNIRLVIDPFFRELNLVPDVVMEAEDTEAIKRLVESGFGYSILPGHAGRGTYFFHTLRVKGHRLTRSLALAMAQADYRRSLTESIAAFCKAP